jgi:Family of unknown function (DUF6035)
MSKSAIDPLAQAQPAKELKIFEMMDCETGEFIDTRKFICDLRYGEIFPHRHEIRRRWKTETPKYICSDCGVPVSLLAGVERNWFYFRHLHEDGRCKARTRGELSQKQINAIRYAATRESQAHILFKTLMFDCLMADQQFSDVQIETVRVSGTEKGKWRKPDVSANREGLLHAFEVQLSSTFLDTILDRQSFYRANGGILIWVLPSFDPTDHGMMEDDILFSNNSNIFVLNEDVAKISIASKRLHFGCWYRFPFEQNRQLTAEWRYEIVPFSTLTLDLDRQRVFFFDYHVEQERVCRAIDEERSTLMAELAAAKERDRRADLIWRLEHFWQKYSGNTEGSIGAWTELLENGEFDNLNLPSHPFHDDKLNPLLDAMLSAKYGTPVGWRFSNIAEVGHHVFDKHRYLFALFAICLKHYGHDDTVAAVDKTGSLRAKFQQARKSPKSERASFALEDRYHPLADLLFPEPHQKLNLWIG